MEKILGFYHICMVNDWFNIVKEQISLIIKSKLYDKTEEIFVSCLGSKEHKEILYNLLPDKFTIVFYDSNVKLYEIPILNYIQNKAKVDEFFAWYIHTKGVTSSVFSNERNITAWRHMMEYFIIENHAKCLTVLENPKCDACGVKLRCDGEHCYYAGNFWWSKSSYIRKLPSIVDKFKKSKTRFSAETMIGNHIAPRLYAFEFYANYKNFYHNCANPSIYRQNNLPIPKFPVDKQQIKYLKRRIKFS